MAEPVSASIWARPGIVLLVGLLGAILGAVLSPLVTQYLSDQKQPVLQTEERRPNLYGLDDNTLKQISLVSTTYVVRHSAGAQADNVAVRLQSSEPLNPGSIAVDAGAELAALKPVNDHTIQLDLAHMRPGTVLSITVTHRPSAKLEWETIAGNAVLTSSLETPNNWREVAIALTVVGAISLSVIGAAFLVASWVRRRAIAQSAAEQGGSGGTLAFWIAFAIVINIALRVGGRFLGISSIPLDDVFYGLLIFLIVTNWTAISSAIAHAGAAPRRRADGASTEPEAPAVHG